MKARMYWSYATRSLVRGGQRSLLAIFCVAVGVMAIVALQLVSNAINAGLTGNIRALNGGDVAISSTSAPLSASQLRYFDSLQSQGAITAYTAVDNVSGQTRTASGARRFFQMDAVDPARFPIEGAPVFSSPGTASLTSALHGTSVVITTTLAQTLNITVGDTMPIYMRDGRSANVTIGGIIQDTGLLKGPVLLMNIAAYTSLPSTANQPVSYSQIYADVPGHSESNAVHVETLIQQQFPLMSVQTTAQAAAGNQTQVRQIQYFLQVVGLLALLIGGVGIVNTMQVLLRRRRIEIAMLKTTGYRRRDLYALFGLEASLIGLVGGIVGTAAGVGVSFLVKGLMETTIEIALPTTIDAQTVAAGVAVGFFTSLIFGLLPIAQASQVRPQAVLRDVAERANWKTRITSGILFGLLAVLFFALALGVLRNVGVAALAVGGTGAFLAVLSLFLGIAVLVISKLPIPESLQSRYTLVMSAALLAAAALTVAAPAFGVLLLIVALMGLAVAALPRQWKANMKLALRNIGRQKVRTVATLLALYIGVFSIGLILVLGQNIRDTLNSYLASGTRTNAEIFASSADKQAVEQELTQIPGLTHEMVAPFTQAVPVSVNGQPIAQVVQAATANNANTVNAVTSVMNGVEGYDLASGAAPNLAAVAIVKGDHDAQAGRTLNASDAGTNHALLPVSAAQAPDNLKLGDTITVASQAHATPITVTIVGFYSSNLPQFAPILADAGLVSTLSAGSPQYGFAMHLNPASADATLARIQEAVPGASMFSLSDFVDQYAMQLNSLITALVAVTSLALLASIIIIANAVALAMLERRRELGILKAVGHTSRSVLGEVLVENGIVGFTGALLAMLVVAAAASILGKVAFNLPMTIPTPTVLVVVGATMVACMVVAASVAWSATRVRPVEVLRYE